MKNLIPDPQLHIFAQQQSMNLQKRDNRIRESRRKVRQSIAPAHEPQFTRVRANPDAITFVMNQVGVSCYALLETQGLFTGTSKLIVHPMPNKAMPEK